MLGHDRRPLAPAYAELPVRYYRSDPGYGYGQYPAMADRYPGPAAAAQRDPGYPGPATRADSGWAYPGYGQWYPNAASRYQDPAAAGQWSYGYPGPAARPAAGWRDPDSYFGEESAPPVPAYALPLPDPRDTASGYHDYTPRYDRPFFPGQRQLPGRGPVR